MAIITTIIATVVGVILLLVAGLSLPFVSRVQLLMGFIST
jgi:hypothetical protein